VKDIMQFESGAHALTHALDAVLEDPAGMPETKEATAVAIETKLREYGWTIVPAWLLPKEDPV
jgi:hypothetical protein